MIRDEFKNADKKTINQKAKINKTNVNTREYLAKKMARTNELFAPVKFSTIFCLVCFSLLALLYLLCIIFGDNYKIEWHCIVVLSVEAALIIWAIVWFAVLVPSLKKKAAYYKSELERLSREYVMKNVRK